MSEAEIKKTLLQQFEKGLSIYESEIYLIIETNQGESIGMVRFQNINWKNRTLIISIYISPEKYKNGLFGADALFAGLAFAFNELNMHKILGNIYEFNKRSFRMAERGYTKREATLRKHIFKSGKYYDMYIYGILRSEYEQLLAEAEHTFFRKK